MPARPASPRTRNWSLASRLERSGRRWRRPTVEHRPEGPPSALVSEPPAANGWTGSSSMRASSRSERDGPGRRRALALAADPEPGSPLLSQEIFGPVLPLVQVDGVDAAIEWIDARAGTARHLSLHPRPRGRAALLLASTRAGALVVNGTVVQAAIEALPFGGVGASGFGRYHGRAGFDTFSNRRVHVRVARFSLARLADPPYTPAKRRLIDWLLRIARL